MLNKCNLCPKVFENQHYLDKHFSNKHVDRLEPRVSLSITNSFLALICFLYLIIKPKLYFLIREFVSVSTATFLAVTRGTPNWHEKVVTTLHWHKEL